LAARRRNHGKEAQGQKEGCEVEETCDSGAQKEGRIQASCEKVGEAEAAGGENQIAAARQSAERIASDDAARSRGHADRAAAVAVSLVGAG